MFCVNVFSYDSIACELNGHNGLFTAQWWCEGSRGDWWKGGRASKRAASSVALLLSAAQEWLGRKECVWCCWRVDVLKQLTACSTSHGVSAHAIKPTFKSVKVSWKSYRRVTGGQIARQINALIWLASSRYTVGLTFVIIILNLSNKCYEEVPRGRIWRD